MKRKTNKISEDVSNLEFQGLASFEEIDSYTLIKEFRKKGKIKSRLENCVDGVLVKKTKLNKKKSKLGSTVPPKGTSQHISSDIAHKGNSLSKAKKKNKDCNELESVISNKNNEKPRKFIKPDRINNFFETATSIEKGIENLVNVDAWTTISTPDVVIEAIKSIGFKEPTPIQKYTIPAAILRRCDIIGAAETGSGKTLAFLIPIIHGILKKKSVNLTRPDLSFEEIGKRKRLHSNFDDECVKSDDLDEFERESSSESNVDSDPESDDDGIDCVDVDEINSCFPCQNSIKNRRHGSLLALIVTPTRELAVQIQKHAEAVLVKTDIKCVSVIGGFSQEKQERLLKRGPEIVIGTPGRLWEMYQQSNGHLSQLPYISFLAIDETDRMLEKNHFEELQSLLHVINEDETSRKQRQNFIFSATLTLIHAPPLRPKLKKKMEYVSGEMKLKQLSQLIGIRKNCKIVDITRKIGTAESLSEAKIFCDENEKDHYLFYFLKSFPGRTLVFCNSINCVKRLSNLLTILQFKPQTLHASKQQKQRLKSLEKFERSDFSVLLATDVAARGIDVPAINHIIHYEVPPTAETYVHRSGRTARADQEGLSVLFIGNKEIGRFKNVCQTLNRMSSIPSFPVDEDLLTQARLRVDLAREIEKNEFGKKKKNKEIHWLQKMALEADIEFQNSVVDDDEACEQALENRKLEALQKQQRARLCQLLSQPMTKSTFSGRYPTSTGKLVIPEEFLTKTGPGALKTFKDTKNVFHKPFKNSKKMKIK